MSKYLPGYTLKADITQYSRHVSKVPDSDISSQSRSFRQAREPKSLGILFDKFRLLVGAEVGHQTRYAKLRIDGVQSRA